MLATMLRLFLSTGKLHDQRYSFFRGAHCSDMYPARANDHPELIEARKKIGELLGGFIRNN